MSGKSCPGTGTPRPLAVTTRGSARLTGYLPDPLSTQGADLLLRLIRRTTRCLLGSWIGHLAPPQRTWLPLPHPLTRPQASVVAGRVSPATYAAEGLQASKHPGAPGCRQPAPSPWHGSTSRRAHQAVSRHGPTGLDHALIGQHFHATIGSQPQQLSARWGCEIGWKTTAGDHVRVDPPVLRWNQMLAVINRELNDLWDGRRPAKEVAVAICQGIEPYLAKQGR